MPTYDSAEHEALDAFRAMIATRNRITAGEVEWGEIAKHFTEDAVFCDPAWGVVEGHAAIVEFMNESMQGLGNWEFPEEWVMVDGTRVVAHYQNRLPGTEADGHPHQAPGISILEYAGDGLFSSETDIINMVHMFEVIGAANWQPTAELNMPPQAPRRR